MMKIVVKSQDGVFDEIELPDNWDSMTEKEQQDFEDEHIQDALSVVDVFVIKSWEDDYDKY
jgi:hypothetical protein